MARFSVKQFICDHVTHIVIMGLFIIFFIHAIRMSSIPIITILPPFLKTMFIKPKDGSVLMEIEVFVNNLGMAYIASIVTYLVVQYFPTKQKAKKSMAIFENNFVSLYMIMSELISMYLFEIGVEDKKEKEISEADLQMAEETMLIDETKWARKLDYRNGIRGSSLSEYYNFYKDAQQYCESILKQIEKIKKSPSAQNLDDSVVDILSKIEGCRFLFMITKMQPYKKIPGYQTIIFNQDKSLFEFIQYHLALNRYSFDKITFRFEKMTSEEIKTAKKKHVLCINRGIIHDISIETIENYVEQIIQFVPDDDTLNKAEGVLLEILIAYDSGCKCGGRILEAGMKLASHILENRKGEMEKAIAFCNLIQIKIRLKVSLSEKEIRILKKYETSEDKKLELGCAILLKDAAKEELVFASLSEDERKLFVELPIYRLWDNPPVPACEDPRLFSNIGT